MQSSHDVLADPLLSTEPAVDPADLAARPAISGRSASPHQHSPVKRASALRDAVRAAARGDAGPDTSLHGGGRCGSAHARLRSRRSLAGGAATTLPHECVSEWHSVPPQPLSLAPVRGTSRRWEVRRCLARKWSAWCPRRRSSGSESAGARPGVQFGRRPRRVRSHASPSSPEKRAFVSTRASARSCCSPSVLRKCKWGQARRKRGLGPPWSWPHRWSSGGKSICSASERMVTGRARYGVECAVGVWHA